MSRNLVFIGRRSVEVNRHQRQANHRNHYQSRQKSKTPARRLPSIRQPQLYELPRIIWECRQEDLHYFSGHCTNAYPLTY